MIIIFAVTLMSDSVHCLGHWHFQCQTDPKITEAFVKKLWIWLSWEYLRKKKSRKENKKSSTIILIVFIYVGTPASQCHISKWQNDRFGFQVSQMQFILIVFFYIEKHLKMWNRNRFLLISINFIIKMEFNIIHCTLQLCYHLRHIVNEVLFN